MAQLQLPVSEKNWSSSIDYTVASSTLTLFPGHSHLQSFITCSKQIQSGKAQEIWSRVLLLCVGVVCAASGWSISGHSTLLKQLTSSQNLPRSGNETELSASILCALL